MGFDVIDPKTARNFRIALNVFHAASDRQRAKKKSEWDKINPEGVELLRWARNADEGVPSSNEFKFQVLQRPKDK